MKLTLQLIVVCQVFFQQGRVALRKWRIGPQKGHLRTPGMEFFCTVPTPHFLGRALIWPGCFGEHILGLFGLYSSSLSKSVGFVSLSGKASLVSISATIVWIWTNYCKLSRNFVGAIRTKTINCRVSFIDLYLVFPRNSGIVFLPHTNTVILLEPYCGTITEPGLPGHKQNHRRNFNAALNENPTDPPHWFFIRSLI